MSTVNKPEGYSLSFDIKIWFYFERGRFMLGYSSPPPPPMGLHGLTGALNIIQNNTAIDNISSFYWSYDPRNKWVGYIAVDILELKVFSDNSKAGYQKVVELFNKKLFITVDGVTYHIDSDFLDAGGDGHTYTVKYVFSSDREKVSGIAKLIAIMKQKGETKHFHLNWHD